MYTEVAHFFSETWKFLSTPKSLCSQNDQCLPSLGCGILGLLEIISLANKKVKSQNLSVEVYLLIEI